MLIKLFEYVLLGQVGELAPRCSQMGFMADLRQAGEMKQKMLLF
jgi:hypothetical protein